MVRAAGHEPHGADAKLPFGHFLFEHSDQHGDLSVAAQTSAGIFAFRHLFLFD